MEDHQRLVCQADRLQRQVHTEGTRTAGTLREAGMKGIMKFNDIDCKSLYHL